MRVHNVLELIFGSPAKVRILRVLTNAPQPLSGRQVGELSGLTHRGAIQALPGLPPAAGLGRGLHGLQVLRIF